MEPSVPSRRRRPNILYFLYFGVTAYGEAAAVDIHLAAAGGGDVGGRIAGNRASLKEAVIEAGSLRHRAGRRYQAGAKVPGIASRKLVKGGIRRNLSE
jgi:hypothetical protein